MASDFELDRQQSEDLRMRARELLRENQEARAQLRSSVQETKQVVEEIDKVSPPLTTLIPHRPS